MEISGVPAAAQSLHAVQLAADVGFSMQRKALDAVSSQVAQLLEAMPTPVPAGLTFTPGGPSAGDQRRDIARL